jgi:hypothetical protein
MTVTLYPCDHVLCARCYNEMSFYRRLAHGDPPPPASEYKCPTCRSPFTWSTAKKFSSLPVIDDDDLLEVGVVKPTVKEAIDLTTPDSKLPAFSSEYRLVSNSYGKLYAPRTEDDTTAAMMTEDEFRVAIVAYPNVSPATRKKIFQYNPPVLHPHLMTRHKEALSAATNPNEDYVNRRDATLENSINFIASGGITRNPNALSNPNQQALVNALITTEAEERVKLGLRPIPAALQATSPTSCARADEPNEIDETPEEILTTLKDNINNAYNAMERSVKEAKAKFNIKDIPTLKRSIDELIETTDEYKYAVDCEIDEHIAKIKKVKASTEE